MKECKSNHTKVVIYGGNGFVGTHIAEQLVAANACVVCLSRTGHKPLHLKDQEWSTRSRWCKGDASAPDTKLLQSVDTLVCCVGSAPTPTFSAEAYEQQLFMNGVSSKNAINAAAEAGVQRIVLIGARIPFAMKTNRFAYYKGKQMALSAAKEFAALSSNHSAIVLQPGMITGQRFLENGKSVRLDWMTAPIAPLMPWQFVSVKRVAKRVADAALNEQPYAGKFTVLSNRDI